MKLNREKSEEQNKIRVLIAKPGLDGHETGAKIVSILLRDSGMEVIYTGPRQTAEDIVTAAIQENADVIGLSILSGTYLHYCSQVVTLLEQNGAGDIPIILGGIIHPADIPRLKQIGVKAVFGPQHEAQEMVRKIRGIAAK